MLGKVTVHTIGLPDAEDSERTLLAGAEREASKEEMGSITS